MKSNPAAVTRARVSLRSVYATLLAHHGPAGWWPAETAFEVCVGAVLVQNTSWSNVERALESLRRAGRLDFRSLDALEAEAIAPLVRPAGCYRVKARRLRALLDFLGARFGGDVAAMAREAPSALRAELLAVRGVGPETADSILLYAAGLPVFVIDAYTRRVFARLGLISGHEPYDALQGFFEQRLPRRASLYNEFHAQIVTLAKGTCRPRPLCSSCPLERVCGKHGL